MSTRRSGVFQVQTQTLEDDWPEDSAAPVATETRRAAIATGGRTLTLFSDVATERTRSFESDANQTRSLAHHTDRTQTLECDVLPQQPPVNALASLLQPAGAYPANMEEPGTLAYDADELAHEAWGVPMPPPPLPPRVRQAALQTAPVAQSQADDPYAAAAGAWPSARAASSCLWSAPDHGLLRKSTLADSYAESVGQEDTPTFAYNDGVAGSFVASPSREPATTGVSSPHAGRDMADSPTLAYTAGEHFDEPGTLAYEADLGTMPYNADDMAFKQWNVPPPALSRPLTAGGSTGYANAAALAALAEAPTVPYDTGYDGFVVGLAENPDEMPTLAYESGTAVGPSSAFFSPAVSPQKSNACADTQAYEPVIPSPARTPQPSASVARGTFSPASSALRCSKDTVAASPAESPSPKPVCLQATSAKVSSPEAQTFANRVPLAPGTEGIESVALELRRLRGKQAPHGAWSALYACPPELTQSTKSGGSRGSGSRARGRGRGGSAATQKRKSSSELIGEAAGPTNFPAEMGSVYEVRGDGWGSGSGSYRARVTEADDQTFTLINIDAGPSKYEESTVLREHCILVEEHPSAKRARKWKPGTLVKG